MQDNKKGLHKYKGLRSVSESYQEYESNYPKSSFDKKLYLKIILTFFKECLNYLIEGGEVRFPFMGVLYVSKKKRDLNKLRVNWNETMKLWEQDEEAKLEKRKVYFLNEHSNGYHYRFHWRKGKVKNISVYAFLPVRSAKKKLSEAILINNADYLA